MLKSLLTFAFVSALIFCNAQVKIGTGSTTQVDPSAVLELSNDLSAPPSNWKTFLPPNVDFSRAVFTSSAVWGVSGSPVSGALVFNTGNVFSNGFTGPGIYCWMGDKWSPLNHSEDKLRWALGTSMQAYDTAAENTWIMITEIEYNNLLAIISGAAKYAANDSFMNLPSEIAWNQIYTVGGNTSVSQIPPSSYIIAWSVRSGANFAGRSQFARVKVSASQLSGYTDYGPGLPDYPTSMNTRYYFLLKRPKNPTGAAPSYTAVYTHHAKFLGGRIATSGMDYFTPSNNETLNYQSNNQSAVQFICTQTKQW